MKKKLALGITITALLAMALIGGTLAWFTSSADVINTIKTGKVKVELTEPDFDKVDGAADNTVLKVVPGAKIAKDPTITNVGDDAKMRYRVDVKLVGKDGNELTLPTGAQAIVFQHAIEGFKTGEWVSLGIVKEKAAAIKLFDSVEIPTTWGNEYQEATLTVNVSVQAAQASNFKDTDWETATFTN
ncbi:MAG: TasA family protein [Lachnospiraceae bacterium]